MDNKLGLIDDKLFEVEKKLINTKLNILDEYFTFNEKKLDLNYLNKINNFLFADIYSEEDIGFRYITENEKKLINKYLDEIIHICIIKKQEIDNLFNLLEKIWDLQPFKIGNTRTLLAYLKILNHAFLLDLNIDINLEIKSGEMHTYIKKYC